MELPKAVANIVGRHRPVKLLAFGAAIVALCGCGAGSNTTASEENAFKHPDVGSIKPPPPGAMQDAQKNFHSSLNDGPKAGAGSTHAPPPGAK